MKFGKYGFFTRKEILQLDVRTRADKKYEVNGFVVASEATAAGYSDRFTVNYATRAVTVTDDATWQQLRDYLEYTASLAANIQYDMMVEGNNTNPILPSVTLTVQAGATLTADGVSITCGSYTIAGAFTGIISDGTNTRVPLTINGIVVDSRYRIEQTDGTLITDGTATSSTVQIYYTHTADLPVNIKVRKASAPVKYLPFNTSGTITNTGLSITVSQIQDKIA